MLRYLLATIFGMMPVAAMSVPIVLDQTTSIVNSHIDSDVVIANDPDLGGLTNIAIVAPGSIAGDLHLAPRFISPEGRPPAREPMTITAIGASIGGNITDSSSDMTLTLFDTSVGGFVSIGDDLEDANFVMAGNSSIGGYLDVGTTSASAIISGGTVGGETLLYGQDTTLISGGNFLDKVHITDQKNVEITGGTFQSSLDMGSLGNYDILGGSFLGGLSGVVATYNIFGGMFEENDEWRFDLLDAFLGAPSALNVYGYNLSYTEGLLTGYLSDHNHISVQLFVPDSTYLNFFETPLPTQVPEPGTLALLGIGLFGMGLARRNKKA